MAKIKFLGSGCWQGIPGQFCEDKISKDVDWDTKDFRFRTSLYIQTDDGKKIIVEITPDIRLQVWKYKVPSPDAFLISHWHWDHLFGIKDLDWYFEKGERIVYGNKTTKEWYDSDMSYIPLTFKEFKPYESFEIGNMKITPFTVEHVEGTEGFIFENLNTKKKVAYFADLSGLPEKSRRLIEAQNIEIGIIDSTYIEKDIEDDETHFKGKALIEFIDSLNINKKILTHISSFQDKNHEQLEESYPKYLFAYDGMEIEF